MFLKNKYTKWYFSIIDKAKQQNRKKGKNTYYEAHHIIPQSMGGQELVLLTGKEHFICHLLLCRMTETTNKHKMINALIRMTFSKSAGQKRHTARSYNLVRSLIAEKNREMFTGRKMPDEWKQRMKGKLGVWARQDEHKERMRGENNPMFGKIGALNPATKLEVRQKIGEANKGNKYGLGNKSVSGMIWVNDGYVSKMVDPNHIPEGFNRGRLKKETTYASS